VRPTIILILVCMIGGGGCATSPREPVTLDPKPILIHLPGTAGNNAFERTFLSSLRTGGFDAQYTTFEWTRGQFMITTLKAYDANRSAGRKLADEIVAIRRAEPDRPVFLSCDSGGAGPLVWGLEALPDDVHVEAALLIAPALSPDYDLSRALAHVNKKMLAFTSPGDRFVLGWGTRTYGTIDGKRTNAAGYVGFTTPTCPALPDQYAKLEQVKYQRAWFGKFGHAGDHTGAMGSRFASGYLAPMLTRLALDANAAAVVAASADEASSGSAAVSATGEGVGVVEPTVEK
jgi:hypothetical protein